MLTDDDEATTTEIQPLLRTTQFRMCSYASVSLKFVELSIHGSRCLFAQTCDRSPRDNDVMNITSLHGTYMSEIATSSTTTLSFRSVSKNSL
jgi:hypothetical protein